MKAIIHFCILGSNRRRGAILNKTNNSHKNIIGSILLIYIGLIMLFNIIISDKDFSDMENRRLEQLPKFSFENIFKGQFISNFEKYISDQFPFRDFFIGVKSYCERISGKKENNGVFLGEDGYLMEKFNKPHDKDFKNRIDVINSFAENTANINKYFILVPNSVKILEDKLPYSAPVDDEYFYMNKVKNGLDKNIKFVDVYDIFWDKKDEYIYYKTDHHWTTKGAFYAYEKLAKSMGFYPHEEDYFNIENVADNFYGSLYSKGGFRNIDSDDIKLYIPKKSENYTVKYYEENNTSDSLYNMDNLNKKDKYTVFLNGNHPLLKINTNIHNGKKLLIIKDSYANSLVPFLTGHFNEIYMIDLRYFEEDLSKFIKNNDIDDILILYNVKSFFEDDSIKKISW